MTPMHLKISRAAGGVVSVRSWVSDPANPAEGFESLELYRAKDEAALVLYLKQLRTEGYEVKVVDREGLDPGLQRAVSEGAD